MLKAWRISEKLLAFGLPWKSKAIHSNVSKGVSNSHGIEKLAGKRRSKLVKSKIPSSISFLPGLSLKALPTLRVSLSTSKNTQKVSHSCARWLLLSSFQIQPQIWSKLTSKIIITPGLALILTATEKYLYFLFFFSFETESHFVVLANLELTHKNPCASAS